MRRLFWLLLVSLVTACNGAPAPMGIDHDAYVQSAASLIPTASALEIADDVLGFDPVLDRTHTADENATDVQAHASGTLSGCGTITRSNLTLTVDFGTTGCTTPSGHVVSGSISLLIGTMGAEATATLTFTSFVLDASALSGTLAFRTGATTLSVSVALTSGMTSLSGTLTVTATSDAFGLDGLLTSTRAVVSTAIAITSLRWTRGDCYPDEGTIDASTGPLDQRIVFSASSAMTGLVEVSEGSMSAAEILPSYAHCPN